MSVSEIPKFHTETNRHCCY